MYIKRKIDDYLLKWKNDKNHLPLLIVGQRQIGKTASIEEFSKTYKNVVEINFALEKKYNEIIKDGYEVDNVIKNISFISNNKKIVPYETLIIFDEIQENPDIATTLKSFAIDNRYDVICSGSLLGFNYKQIHSNSVGYKTEYLMHSFDFEEYLMALNYGNNIINNIYEHMISYEPFSDVEWQIYKNHYFDYVLLGGMPQVIKKFIVNKNFSGVETLKKNIVKGYIDDIRKYAFGLDQTKIVATFNSIPYQLAKENKKFIYSKIRSGAKSKDYIGVVEWLFDAGIINICYKMNFPELPIRGNVDTSKYKIYYRDTGLLISQLDDEAQYDLRANRNLGVYKGAIYENMAADAMFKQGLDLCYYKRDDSTLEEDFFVRRKDELIPIEVKSNNNQSKSLKELIKSDKYPDIKCGIKFANQNIGFDNNIMTFPYFCIPFLREYIKNS